MAPLDGFCPTGALTEPRIGARWSRARAIGVLVVGGTTAGGTPLSTAEYYDPATATFEPIVVPELLGQQRLRRLGTHQLPDGRVVLTVGRNP